MGLLASLGLSLVPSAINALGNLLHGDSDSDYENKLSRMAQLFKRKANRPIDETEVFQQGEHRLDQRAREQRDRIQNSSATSGATNEARLGAMENVNEAYQQGLNNLFARSHQRKQQMRSRYLDVLGAKHRADQRAEADFQRKLGAATSGLQGATNAFMLSQIFNDEGDSPNMDLVSTTAQNDFYNESTGRDIYNPQQYLG